MLSLGIQKFDSIDSGPWCFAEPHTPEQENLVCFSLLDSVEAEPCMILMNEWEKLDSASSLIKVSFFAHIQDHRALQRCPGVLLGVT